MSILILHYNIILMDSLQWAKSSFTWVFSRSFSVLCVPLSMLGIPGGTGYDGVPVPPGPKDWKWFTRHRKTSAEYSTEDFVYWSESITIIYIYNIWVWTFWEPLSSNKINWENSMFWNKNECMATQVTLFQCLSLFETSDNFTGLNARFPHSHCVSNIFH